MIDPRTQWIIYKDKESNLMLYIEWKQQHANEKQQPPTWPWYQQMAEWLSRVVRYIWPGKRSVETIPPACCPAG